MLDIKVVKTDSIQELLALGEAESHSDLCSTDRMLGRENEGEGKGVSWGSRRVREVTK